MTRLLPWGIGLVTVAVAGACLLWIDAPAEAGAAALAVVCIGLWVGELVPAFVPTLLLLVGAALGVGGTALGPAMGAMADPVLALFFGGFVLGEAASVHGLDRVLLRRTVAVARGRARTLVVVVMALTAFLSMWMSNIAAAALVLASLKPAFHEMDDRTRRALLASVAFAANLGGMATPIGTGSNGIAIGAVADPPSFLGWMAFALPLTVGSLAVALGLIALRHGGLPGTVAVPPIAPSEPTEHPGRVAAVAAITIAAWLSEPLHGFPAAGVSLAAAALLFGTGLVPGERLRTLDWSTLLLVAGGIGLGALLETSGLLRGVAGALAASEAPRWQLVLALLGATAAMSAVMSNTAATALLVPVALAIAPGSNSLPILVALAASFGMPFVTSTPPNAMVVGAGAHGGDLLWPGLVLMAGGCGVLTFTGTWVLGAYGF